MTADTATLVKLVRSRIWQDLEGECHLTEAEAQTIADRIDQLFRDLAAANARNAVLTEAVDSGIEMLQAIENGLSDLINGYTPWMDQSDAKALAQRLSLVRVRLAAKGSS